MRAAQSLDQSDYQRLAEFRNRLRYLKFSEHEAAKIGLPNASAFGTIVLLS
jgi:hypothetical protein